MISRINGKIKDVKSQGGFSLIELLIALAIFSIGFLAVGVMQIGGLTKTNSSRDTSMAMALVDARAEALMATPFHLDDNGIDDDGKWGVDYLDANPALVAGVYTDNVAGKYTVRWRIVDDTPLGVIPGGPGGYTPAGQDLTQSKTVTVWVTRDNAPGEVLLTLSFAKVMSGDAHL